MERIEGLVAEGRAIDAAYRQNYAFADAKALEADRRAWLASLHYAPGETPGSISAADEATIAYIVAAWRRAPREVS